MHSAIYEGEVMHHRLAPKTYQFRHRVFYLWLDLDELNALDRGLALLKRNRGGLFAFHDRDHLDRGPGSARLSSRAHIAPRLPGMARWPMSCISWS